MCASINIYILDYSHNIEITKMHMDMCYWFECRLNKTKYNINMYTYTEHRIMYCNSCDSKTGSGPFKLTFFFGKGIITHWILVCFLTYVLDSWLVCFFPSKWVMYCVVLVFSCLVCIVMVHWIALYCVVCIIYILYLANLF